MAEYIVQAHSECIVHNLDKICVSGYVHMDFKKSKPCKVNLELNYLWLAGSLILSSVSKFFFEEHCVKCSFKFKDAVYVLFANNLIF